MKSEQGPSRPNRMSTLEKWLIFLFVAMSGICIALTVIYFAGKPDDSTPAEGECAVFEECIEFK